MRGYLSFFSPYSTIGYLILNHQAFVLGDDVHQKDPRMVWMLTSFFLWWFSIVRFSIVMWVWVNTYIDTIFSGMNIHLPAILGFTRGTRFWPIPMLEYQRVRFPNDQPSPVPICPNLQAVVMAWIIRCPCPSSRLGEDIDQPLESQHLKIN